MKSFLERYGKDLENMFMENVRDEIKERVNNGIPMTKEEYHNITANSYERLLMYPILNNDALFDLVCYCYAQSSFHPYHSLKIPDSYDDCVTGVLIPLVLKRFAELMGNPVKKSSYDMGETLP